ncbi:MAG TPA: SRPBCC domain-containing protein [Sphingobacterium sp.]|nr:SRPBCC domain-containing protein [Sphingobacterium sp.]
MAEEIKTKILIHAEPEKVWAVLNDINNYPNWNPFILYIKGEMKVGQRISIKIKSPDAKAMNFYPKVLVSDVNREIRWIGHLWIAGLFDGEHVFKLINNEDGTTTFIQNERFTGILTPLLKKQIKISKKGFEAMNIKLKEWVEKQ